MFWLAWILPSLVLVLAIAALVRRRAALTDQEEVMTARLRALDTGSHRARLVHPDIDLRKCIGCGSCVDACPEEGVLALSYGQAVVVHGARCVGHGRCAEVCPTGAIALTLGDLGDRRDLPAIDDHLEAAGVPGLFLAGEITGFALVRTAVQHGASVGREVARRLRSGGNAAVSPVERRVALRDRRDRAGRGEGGEDGDAGQLLPTTLRAERSVRVGQGVATRGGAALAQERRLAAHRLGAPGAVVPADAAADPVAADGVAQRVFDLVIVGMGPAGLACALAAREQGLDFVALEQQADIGGTVASYPRRKLVMTQPMELPLHGRIDRLEFEKEELVDLWQRLAREHALPVRTGTTVADCRRDGETFVLTTRTGTGVGNERDGVVREVRARNVCFAVGRRGTPRRLGVAGEDLPKVSYSLLDAASYGDRSVLVVGGGDSAVEAALAIAAQPGTCVTMSYRRGAFFRLKARNEQRIREAIDAGRVQALFGTEVIAIAPDSVRLKNADGPAGDELTLPNDDVFVFAGGTPPFPLLEAAGVSLDPADRPARATEVDRGTGLLAALAATLLGIVGLFTLRRTFAAYYDLGPLEREGTPWHELLRPQGIVGLAAGVAAVALFVVNLAYVVRRSRRLGRAVPGSLRGWMSVHVATGLLALPCAVLHSSFRTADSVAGHALLTMAIVVAAGVVGRWFYSFVPRIQNGKRADIEDVSVRLAAIAGEWDAVGRGFGDQVRKYVEETVAAEHFGRGFVGRVVGLVAGQWHLHRLLARVRAEGRAQDVPAGEVRHIVELARRAHRLAMQLAHYDDLRSVLATWRWLHRWLALLLLLLVVAHVVSAVRYGGVGAEIGRWFGGGR